MTEKEIVEQLTSTAFLKEAFDFLEAEQMHSIEEQIDLTCIEAPTGSEETRAKEMCRKFTELGLTDVHVDGIYNAIGVLKGSDSNGKAILFEAHLDTVFPFGSVKKRPEIGEDGIIRCPGIGDDTRGLAVILAVLRAIRKANITPKYDIIFAGTAREEGRGSLGGIRYLINEHPEIIMDISVDGGGFTNITYNATGIKTFKYTFHGKSGHSFGSYGKIANTLGALGRSIAKISEIRVPTEPRSCCTVTSVFGGNIEGLHAYPAECYFVVNFRSNSQEELDRIEKEVNDCVNTSIAEEEARWGVGSEITVECETLCEAGAGFQSADIPIVKAFAEVIKFMGQEPVYGKGGSCNSNIPISKGIPAVCMGGGYPVTMDTHAHSLDECFPTKDLYLLPQAALTLLLTAAGTTTTASIND